MDADRAFLRFFGGLGVFILSLLVIVMLSALYANHQDANLMKACVENGGEWINHNCMKP